MIHRRTRGAAVLAIAAVLIACSPIRSPLDNPVEGARRVTDWVAERAIQAGPFGQGAASPEEILELVRQMEAAAWVVQPEDTTIGTIGDVDGSVVGYTRTTLPQSDHALRAVDVRLDIRNVDGGWQVVSMQRRYHCDAETATELCQ